MDDILELKSNNPKIISILIWVIAISPQDSKPNQYYLKRWPWGSGVTVWIRVKILNIYKFLLVLW